MRQSVRCRKETIYHLQAAHSLRVATRPTTRGRIARPGALATFLTHLIATARQIPQTCERRRADPDEVIAAYRATIERLQKLNKAIRLNLIRVQ